MLQDLKLRKPFSILISQENESLDGLFEEDYSIEHGDDSPISLSIRSSIILQEMYQRKRSR